MMRNSNSTVPPLGQLNRRQLLGSVGGASLAASCASPGRDSVEEVPSDLEAVFRTPPRDARPGVVWHWIGGQVTREGISRDLEAMGQAGFGRAVLFSVSLRLPRLPELKEYHSLTPEWWEMVEHAVSEAGKNDIDIAVSVGDGWATAGGPWITPDLSMQRLTHTETWVRSPETPIILGKPPAVENYYRDIRVVAFPIPETWETSATRPVTTSSSYGVQSVDRLNTFDNRQAVIDSDKAGYIQYSFERPFTVRSVTVQGPDGGKAGAGLELYASDDGSTFRPIGPLAQPRLAEVSALGEKEPAWPMVDNAYVVIGAPATTARHFRVQYSATQGARGPAAIGFDGLKGDPDVPVPAKRLTIASLVLNDSLSIPKINERNAQAWALPLEQLDAATLPDDGCVSSADILDLTSRLRETGTLDWTPPDDRVWKVLRIGHTSTGKINETGHPAGRGLESDKLRADVTRIHFDGWLGELARRVDRTGAGKALTWMLMDSWECGSQNWSPIFADEFLKRRGYDIQKFVPVLVGTPIDDADTCERILTDFRRTISELVQDNFFGEMKRLGEIAGFKFAAQSANPIFPVDPLAAARHVEESLGEFWLKGDDKPSDIAEAIHGGHVYGRRVIGAEAFTEFGMDWRETPYTCKPAGDANWAKGINRLTCHVWASQPWTDEAHEPGMTLADIGVFFSRTNTWFGMAKAWFDYMRRSQALLQQGRPVIDVCCYVGENTPVRAYLPSNVPVPVPDGYSFDSINSDVLLRLAQVQDGDIVLPQGQRYKILVLPNTEAMTPLMLERVAELARAGATIVGAPPKRSISLHDRTQADARVQKLAAEMWGTTPSSGLLNTYGAGRVGQPTDLAPVLREIGALPDVIIDDPGRTPGAASPIMWTHRTGPDWDIYFFSNQSASEKSFDVSVRVKGRQPELWDAAAGTSKRVAAWTESGEHCKLAIRLEPFGSTFLVLRARANPDRALSVVEGAVVLAEAEGSGFVMEATAPGSFRVTDASGTSKVIQVSPLPAPMTLEGPWAVTFTKGLAVPKTVTFTTLQSWNASADSDVKFYAGVASYELDWRLEASHFAPDLRWMLDLGDVAELCEVRINSTLVGSLWKPPFIVDVTDAIAKGVNRVRVDVANTWRNRLIADAALPPDQRRSFTTIPFFRGARQVGPSSLGAVGPVFDDNGLFFGGGYGNDFKGTPFRGSPAGTAPPEQVGVSRYGFPGGGSSAPAPTPFRMTDGEGLVASGLLGPVTLKPVRRLRVQF